MKLTVSFLLFLSVIAVLSSLSFSFQITNKWRGTSVSNTKLFEDFNLDFDNPKIVTAKEIFTEKQYREFIKTYSTDERFSLVDFVLGFFKKNEDDTNQSTSSPSPVKATKQTSVPDYAKALKPTVSIGVLQEKTASFIQGKIDGKSFYTVLKAAFGDKLVKVLPDIIASLPQDKGDALAKAAK